MNRIGLGSRPLAEPAANRVSSNFTPPSRPHSFLQETPTPPTPGREGGDLQKEGVWHIETVGVGSSWS